MRLLPATRHLLLAPCFWLLASGCSDSQKDPSSEEPFFPARSFLRGQAAAIDTSLYNIVKVETSGGRIDTSNIPREAFRDYARPFTDMPDIASEDLREDYKETKTYDEASGRVVLLYEATDKDAPIRRQDVTFDPDPSGNAKVRTVYVRQIREKGDSLIDQDMIWQVGWRFRITTRASVGGAAPVVRKLEVFWDTAPPAN